MSQHTPSIEPTLLPPDTAELWLPPLPPSLGFGPEHQLLRESARRFLSEKSPTSTVRALAEDTVGFDRAVYREMADLGWLDYRSRPDEDGSLGPLHVALLLEEMGRRLLPSPYLSSLLALSLLERADDCEVVRALRARIASGDAVVSIAWCEPADGGELARVQTRATLAEVGFALHGEKCHVHWGHAADVVLLPCREPKGTIGVFALELPADGALVEPEVCVDSTRRTARLSLDGVRVRREARLPVDGLEALRALEIAGAALLSAEMVGAADAVLELTRAYAIERTQFGRAIGSFQAVKHPLVDVMIGVEQAKSLALGACVLLGSDAAEVAARMAKAMASDVFAFAVKKGVQLHGGFGFTWDCDVQLYFKRMLLDRATFGDAVAQRRILGRRLFGGPG
jgi:acyl-CoA dehydrogenase